MPPLPKVIVPRLANRFDGGWALRDDGLAKELRRLLATLAGSARGSGADEPRAA